MDPRQNKQGLTSQFNRVRTHTQRLFQLFQDLENLPAVWTALSDDHPLSLRLGDGSVVELTEGGNDPVVYDNFDHLSADLETLSFLIRQIGARTRSITEHFPAARRPNTQERDIARDVEEYEPDAIRDAARERRAGEERERVEAGVQQQPDLEVQDEFLEGDLGDDPLTLSEELLTLPPEAFPGSSPREQPPSLDEERRWVLYDPQVAQARLEEQRQAESEEQTQDVPFQGQDQGVPIQQDAPVQKAKEVPRKRKVRLVTPQHPSQKNVGKDQGSRSAKKTSKVRKVTARSQEPLMLPRDSPNFMQLPLSNEWRHPFAAANSHDFLSQDPAGLVDQWVVVLFGEGNDIEAYYVMQVAQFLDYSELEDQPDVLAPRFSLWSPFDEAYLNVHLVEGEWHQLRGEPAGPRRRQVRPPGTQALSPPRPVPHSFFQELGELQQEVERAPSRQSLPEQTENREQAQIRAQGRQELQQELRNTQSQIQQERDRLDQLRRFQDVQQQQEQLQDGQASQQIQAGELEDESSLSMVSHQIPRERIHPRIGVFPPSPQDSGVRIVFENPETATQQPFSGGNSETEVQNEGPIVQEVSQDVLAGPVDDGGVVDQQEGTQAEGDQQDNPERTEPDVRYTTGWFI